MARSIEIGLVLRGQERLDAGNLAQARKTRHIGLSQREHVDVGPRRKSRLQLGRALGGPRDADDLDLDGGVGLLEGFDRFDRLSVRPALYRPLGPARPQRSRSTRRLAA